MCKNFFTSENGVLSHLWQFISNIINPTKRRQCNKDIVSLHLRIVQVEAIALIIVSFVTFQVVWVSKAAADNGHNLLHCVISQTPLNPLQSSLAFNYHFFLSPHWPSRLENPQSTCHSVPHLMTAAISHLHTINNPYSHLQEMCQSVRGHTSQLLWWDTQGGWCQMVKYQPIVNRLPAYPNKQL